MFDPPDKEYDEVTTSVDMSTVMEWFVKGFQLKDKKILKYDWAINPLTNIFINANRM